MEYVARIDDLLEASLSREALADEDKHCRHCTKNNIAIWRCKDCNMGTPMCRACIRGYHKTNPFHRIEHWNGHYFRPADLWEVGSYLLVRHHKGIAMCDRLTAQEMFLDTFEERKDSAEQDLLKTRSVTTSSSATSSSSATTSHNEHNSSIPISPPTTDIDPLDVENNQQDDEDFLQYIQRLKDDADYDSRDADINKVDEEVEDDLEVNENDEPEPNRYLPDKIDIEFPIGDVPYYNSAQTIMGSYIRVVHTNGIHNIAMISCECQGHDMLPKDLIASRLLPASFERIRTLFSQQLLDRFRLCNLELKSSAYHFYHLLKRMTCPMAPDTVVDLYREFRRMSRIWRWMKRLKWAGYGNHDKKANEVKDGELAVFCPTCPQPGVNIPDNWKSDPARYIFNALANFIYISNKF